MQGANQHIRSIFGISFDMQTRGIKPAIFQ